MTYKEKIEQAELAANDILNNKLTEENVRESLIAKGFNDRDIINILTSTKNIIGESLLPLIREKLLNNQNILNSDDFKLLDPELLSFLIKQEEKAIIEAERKKVSKFLRDGTPHSEIVKHINLNFYPEVLVNQQIANFSSIEEKNSVSSRMIYMSGGIGLILLGIIISYITIQNGGRGRLFYGLVIFGFVTFLKGFFTEPNPN